MRRLPVLVRGEFERLKKYNLFAALMVTLAFWVGISWFLEGEQLRLYVPFVFLADSTMMTILLVGATLFYEKQEHTVNSIMVSPVTEDEYLLTKVIVTVVNSLLTVVVVSAALYLMKGETLRYWLLVPAVVAATAVHSLIGIWLAYHAKNFSSVLVNAISYVLLFLLPPVLLLVGVIPEAAGDYLIVLPPEAAMLVIGAAVADVETWRLVVSFGYLAALSVVLYRYLVRPKFGDFLMRETGV